MSDVRCSDHPVLSAVSDVLGTLLARIDWVPLLTIDVIFDHLATS